jgi:hypothetical protein
LRLFGLDEAHSQIVRGHQILSNITSGITESLLAEATEIGLFRARDSELYLHDSMSDHLATRSMLDEQKEMHYELLQHLSNMKKDYPSSSLSCDIFRKDLIINSGPRIL